MKSLLSRFMIGITTPAIALTTAAFPIAPVGTEGLPVITSGGEVVAKYEGNSASYSNDLFLERDALGNPGMDGNPSNDLFIFNNHLSAVGSTLSLGTFGAGLELVFRLHVNNTGYDFYSGLPVRNPDGLPHARVQDSFLPGTTLVSFEDLLNLPEFPGGFNDLSFTFTNTRAPVPDGGTTGALLGLSFLIIGLARRKVA